MLLEISIKNQLVGGQGHILGHDLFSHNVERKRCTCSSTESDNIGPGSPPIVRTSDVRPLQPAHLQTQHLIMLSWSNKKTPPYTKRCARKAPAGAAVAFIENWCRRWSALIWPESDFFFLYWQATLWCLTPALCSSPLLGTELCLLSSAGLRCCPFM